MSRRMSLVADLVSLFRLWRLLCERRPDLVHSHTPKAGLLGTIAARLAGVPAVALSVFGLPQMTRTGPMGWLLDATTRLSCFLADWVWCDSASLRAFMIERRLCRPEKLVVLGQGSVAGIDSVKVFCPDHFSSQTRNALRARYNIAPDDLVVGFVGRLVCDKGLRELSIAWRALRDRYPQLHLVLVGPSEERDGLPIEVVAMLCADKRVHLTGMIDDVAAHLAIMDVFINPSYREGFGVANLEASAMGLAVVSTKIPGCVDSVQDGVSGVLVPPRDAFALEEAIDDYLSHRELRKLHGRAGRERVVRSFQPIDHWRALERAYLNLLDQNHGARERRQPSQATTHYDNAELRRIERS
jgi:glycosyltransferase involved in cell wall biosynthesis